MRELSLGSRIAILLAAVLSLSVLVQSPAPAAGRLIVPGVAIGNWNLDRALAGYLFEFGTRDVRLNATDLVFRRELVETWWSVPPFVLVHAPSASLALAIGTTDTGARTLEGLGVGSSEQQVTAVYGVPPAVLELPLRSKTLIYGDPGVAFELSYIPEAKRYGVAGRVWVFRPGQAGAIWRLP